MLSFRRPVRILYGSAIFLGAFLLFVVEPMAAKRLLPALGGSAAVWITCLVFFQTTLLLGYLYAHALTKFSAPQPSPPGAPSLSARSWRGGWAWTRWVHIALLALAVILLILLPQPSLSGASAHPFTAIFSALSLSIGVPFLLLASTSPLLQVWMARQESGSIPWRLFALSNAGSLLALLLYPSLIEPRLTLPIQRLLWIAGFILYALLCTAIALRPRQADTAGAPCLPKLETWEAETLTPQGAPFKPDVGLSGPGASFMPDVRSSGYTRLLWFLLPAAASIQLCAVTEQITQTIAAIPLLWIIPLALYLLTFIIAFDAPRVYRRTPVQLLLLLIVVSLAWILEYSFDFIPVMLTMVLFLGELFLACYVCHAETYLLRPADSSEATSFYLSIAAGGSAGAIFVGLACPLLFNANYDMALSLIALASAALLASWKSHWRYRAGWAVATGALFFLPFLIHRTIGRHNLLVERNFYSFLRVRESRNTTTNLTARALLQGVSVNGVEWFGPQHRPAPVKFYPPDSGLGLALRLCCGHRPIDIGVIGMGTGAVAAYSRPGDRITFYELNPAVPPIARRYFTYIADSEAMINVVPGDGRMSLESEPPQHFDVIVIDAFLGDAIPVHLLTTQAMKTYLRQLAPDGILAFNLSNPYVNLPREVAALAQASGMESREIVTSSDSRIEQYGSTWVLVSANRRFMDLPGITALADPDPLRPTTPWTDERSSLLPVLNWRSISPW